MVKGDWVCVITVEKKVTGKKECPVLDKKGKSAQVKSDGLVAPVHKPLTSASESVAPFDMKIQTTDIPEADQSYQISDGSVKLKGGDEDIPVEVLRGSGAMHSSVWEAILPFSPQSDTGDGVPCGGLALQTPFRSRA